MNKKDTADLAELVSNLNKSISDIEDGRFHVNAGARRGPWAVFDITDRHLYKHEMFEVRWYTLKRNDGLTCYNPEILERVNRFIVERRNV